MNFLEVLSRGSKVVVVASGDHCGLQPWGERIEVLVRLNADDFAGFRR